MGSANDRPTIDRVGNTGPSLPRRLLGLLGQLSLPAKILAVLLLLFLCKGIVTAFVFPPYSGHDEVMHYAYLRVLAEEGRVPIIPDLEEWREQRTQPGVEQPAFDHAPEELFRYANKGRLPKLSFTTEDWWGDRPFTIWVVDLGPDFFPSGWIYTANHPPLFYLLLTPVYWLVQGMDIDQQMYAFRLATIPFGMVTVLFAYLTVRTIFPRDHFLAITVPAFIAFQPQISYEAAMLNNDILAIALTSIVFYLLALGLRRGFPWHLCVVTGLAFGLAVLAKNTSVVTGAVIAVAMVLGLGIGNIRAWLPRGLLTVTVTALLVWPWYLHMYRTYGDPTALNRVDALQWWNYDGGPGRTILDQLTDRQFAWDRWNETWGDFGWRLIKLDPALLWLLFWVCLVGLLGVIWWAVQATLGARGRVVTFRSEHGYLALPGVVHFQNPRAPRRPDPLYRPDRVTIVAVITLIIACLTAYYAILQFGTTFSLTQARYYFPTLLAFAVLVMLGYRALTPRRWHAVLATLIVLGWFALNVAVYTVYVIPYWTRGN